MNNFTLMHIEWSDGWGGQEIRIVSESKALREMGVNIIIVARKDSKIYQNAIDNNFHVLPLKMTKGLNLISIIRLAKFIKKNNVDIIHTHSSVDSRIGGIAAKFSGIKVVRSRHISIPVSKSYLTRFQYVHLADKVITSGIAIKKTLVKVNNMPNEHIISIPAGVNPEIFSYKSIPEFDVRKKHGISEKKFLVLMVSVLRSWKGHNYVIESFKQNKELRKNFHLLILGDGPKREEIENLIKLNNLNEYVSLIGHQKDTVSYYHGCDVVILPSYAGEATSQTLPQAMLMKKAVITTNIGGLPEVISNGVNGIMIPPRDPDSIFKALQKYQQDTDFKNRMVEEAYLKAKKFFTFDKMILDTLNVYKDLLKL